MSGQNHESMEWWSDHRTEITESDDVRVDVFLRSLGSPAGVGYPETTVVETLGELEEMGRIDSYTLSVWGNRIQPAGPYAETAIGRFLLEKVEAFQAWARNTPGAEVPLEFREVSSLVGEETHEELRPPYACLAVYADGDLSAVLPARFGADRMSVQSYLEMLRTLPTPGQFRAEGTREGLTTPGPS